jgi:flagellar biosynthesis protein FliQ
MDTAQSQVIDWCREALRVALLLGGPAVLAALVIGVVVGIGQTLTQMHEPVVGLVPRIVGVLIVVLFVLPWLLGTWVDYATELIGTIPDLI